MYISALLVIFVASRLLWIIQYQPALEQDFEYYQLLALDPTIINGQCLGKPLLWSLLLRTGYAFTGPQIFTGLVINIFLGTAALVLIYRIGLYYNSKAAKIAATLFVLWPDQLTLTSILASEHLALALMLTGIVFFYRWQKRQKASDILLASFFFALTFEARSVLGVLIVAALIMLLQKREWRAILLAISIFVGTHLIYESALGLIGIEAQPSSYIFSLLVGTNQAAAGTWNQSDSTMYSQFGSNCQAANEWAMNTVRSRLESGIPNILNLTIVKATAFTLFGGGYGPYYNRNEVPEGVFPILFSLSLAFQMGISLSGLAATILRSYRLPNVQLILLVLFLLTLAHMILEVANRYSFMTMPLWFIVIAATLTVRRRLAVNLPGES